MVISLVRYIVNVKIFEKILNEYLIVKIFFFEK